MNEETKQKLNLKNLRLSLSTKRHNRVSFEEKHQVILNKKRSRSIINCKNILSFDVKEELFNLKDNGDLRIDKTPASPIHKEEEWVLELTNLLSEKCDRDLHIPTRKTETKLSANPLFSGYPRRTIPLNKRRNN